MRRIIAQARKELTQIVRDRLTLAFALVMPLFLLALLGSAISLDVKDLPVVVQDLDQTPLSRQYIEALQGSITFRVASLPPAEQPEQALLAGSARGAIVIPEHFERDLRRGLNAEVQWLIDGTDANTANIMKGNSVAVSQAFIARIRPVPTAPAVRAQMRFWYNPGRESDKYIGPGMFAVGLALFPPLLAALAMSREGEQKTILQVYVSSISAHEFLLGKILAFMVIAYAEWALSLALSFAMFRLHIAGDPTPFLVNTFLYLFCNVCFGAMIGVVIPNQAAAIQATQIAGFLLSFLLSGFIFPISNIPVGVRWVSSLVPARYYIEVVRDAFVRGAGWPAVWQAPLMLTALGLTFFTIAWLRMRRMQVEA
ncbi:MAG: ABC transporter permease [Acidobacteriota bacterium]